MVFDSPAILPPSHLRPLNPHWDNQEAHRATQCCENPFIPAPPGVESAAMWLANRLFPSVRRLQARLAALEAEVDALLTPDELRRWADELSFYSMIANDF